MHNKRANPLVYHNIMVIATSTAQLCNPCSVQEYNYVMLQNDKFDFWLRTNMMYAVTNTAVTLDVSIE